MIKIWWSNFWRIISNFYYNLFGINSLCSQIIAFFSWIRILLLFLILQIIFYALFLCTLILVQFDFSLKSDTWFIFSCSCTLFLKNFILTKRFFSDDSTLLIAKCNFSDHSLTFAKPYLQRSTLAIVQKNSPSWTHFCCLHCRKNDDLFLSWTLFKVGSVGMLSSCFSECFWKECESFVGPSEGAWF